MKNISFKRYTTIFAILVIAVSSFLTAQFLFIKQANTAFAEEIIMQEEIIFAEDYNGFSMEETQVFFELIGVYIAENPDASDGEVNLYAQQEMARLIDGRAMIPSGSDSSGGSGDSGGGSGDSGGGSGGSGDDGYDSGGGKFLGMNVAEQELAKNHIISAFKVNNCKNLAYAKTKYFYGRQEVGGSGDAFRHAYWNALMAIEIGMDLAEQFATAHEYGQTNLLDVEMDLTNNFLGRMDAGVYKDLSYDGMAVEMMKNASSGKYYKTVDGVLVKTDCDGLESEFSDDANLAINALADGGIYYIKNQSSYLYMDVCDNSGESGAKLCQYSLHRGMNQKFKLKKISEDVFELIPMTNTSKRIDINGGSSSDGAAVQIWSSNNGTSQRFKIIRISDNSGAFMILSGNTGYSKCISVNSSDGKLVQSTYSYNGTSDIDHWYFETAYEDTIEDGEIYLIRNQKSDLYMDVRNYSGENGALLNQYHLHKSTNQQFKAKKIGTDVYELIPMTNTNRRVDINGGSSSDGAAVQIWNSNGGIAQSLKIVRVGDRSGAFVILTGNTYYKKCITVQGASTSAGGSVIQWGYSYQGIGDNDHWYFEKYNP